MYRNPTSLTSGNIVSPTRLPSNTKNKDEADLDISVLLEQKRQQLDDEIEQFKAAKDKEFLEFEKGLRRQRQKRKKEQKAAKISEAAISNSEKGQKAGALSLFAGTTNADAQSNGNVASSRDARHLPSSTPTTSLDRRNIHGETTPPPGSSPSSQKLTKQISRSPTSEMLAYTPPKGRSSSKPNPPQPQTITKANHDSFAGVFTPSFLPLLESKSKKDYAASQLPDIKLQRHNSFSNSQSNNDLLSPLTRSERSQTVPVIPSTSLPSALRTASASVMRKRKHVTFQLADSAIVEPSSSYEELPSPEPREEAKEEMNGISKIMTNGRSAQEGSDEDSETGLMPPFSQKQISSPIIKGKEKSKDKKSSTEDGELSPGALPSTLDQADDGGSGVGFFELDEEIASPGFGAVRPFELDEDEDDYPSPNSQNPRRASTTSIEDMESEQYMKQAYVYSGSVPINIIKPSGSWVGSFGH
jgi:hypothetical protein